jgi:hypothetical protein
MIYILLGALLVCGPMLAGLVANNHIRQGGGLMGGFERLATKNPNLQGIQGASGGQVPVIAV